MKQRPRIYYTATQKALMWERWKKGDSLQQIAQLFDRNHSSIQGIFVQTGGIRPPERTRSKLALTLAEREAISRGLASGQSMRSIAAELGDHLPRLVVRLAVMVIQRVIEPINQTSLPGIERSVLRLVNWY